MLNSDSSQRAACARCMRGKTSKYSTIIMRRVNCRRTTLISTDMGTVDHFGKATMKLWLSAEIQDDVEEDHRQIANQIESTINSRLASDYGPAVVQWALITILR